MSDSQQRTIPGVGFLVLAFTDAAAGDQVLDAMKHAKKQKQFYFEDAAVIQQDAQGKVHYHETGDMSGGKGAGIGALVGGVTWASWAVRRRGTGRRRWGGGWRSHRFL